MIVCLTDLMNYMRKLLPFVFPLLMVSILTGAIAYLSIRFRFFFSLQTAGWMVLLFSVALFGMTSGLFIWSNSKSRVKSVLYRLAAFTMGFLLYLLLSVILIDLLHLVTPMSPVFMGLLSLCLPIVILLIGYSRSFRIQTSHYQIKMDGLEKGLTIAHWSDIHLGHFRGSKFLQQIVDKTNFQNPDFVVITGDLFDGKINMSAQELKPLEDIKTPIFFVHGNHDVYSGLNDVFDVVKKAGVRVLQNECIDYQGLQIIGLNHLRADEQSAGMHTTQGLTMREVLGDLPIDKNKPSLLLHHSPDGIKYARQHGINLYLSGHTHGGQQFPVTLLNELLFKYNRGLHDYKGTKILVSEGIGTFGPPVRIGTKSEIVMISLSNSINTVTDG